MKNLSHLIATNVETIAIIFLIEIKADYLKRATQHKLLGTRVGVAMEQQTVLQKRSSEHLIHLQGEVVYLVDFVGVMHLCTENTT